MKKILRLAAVAILAVCTISGNAAAQNGKADIKRLYYIDRSGYVDWTRQEGGRYTVAWAPLSVRHSWLRFDFEMELPQGGQWLQFSVSGRFTPEYRYASGKHDQFYSTRGGKEIVGIGGFGIGAAYKYMFGKRGWYLSAGLDFGYNRVKSYETVFKSFQEDGLVFYEKADALVSRDYFQPAVDVNVGYQWAVSRSVFFDVYAGLGYAYGFCSDPMAYKTYYHYHDSMLWVGYRGVSVNAGLRIGYLFGNR